MNYIVNNIFSVNNDNFSEYAIEVFRYQYFQNKIYRAWVDSFGNQSGFIKKIEDIPFLPVSFFKTAKVVSGQFEAETIFESSGTTQTSNSRHIVKNVGFYLESAIRGFELHYGNLTDWCIIGLLPSYLERTGSSLVVMVDEFIRSSGHPQSGFYLYEYDRLAATLKQLEANRQKTLLIGVTFALLDFAERNPLKLEYTTVMETGGMKGRRREMVRQEVHEILKHRLGVAHIHSEYGMTEMLSQAYSDGGGKFKPTAWMKVLVRDELDPLNVSAQGQGIVNIIDLANIHSCSFIATDDAAIVNKDGTFEILGRIDNSDIRGCSLMIT